MFGSVSEKPDAEVWSLSANIWPQVHSYEQALRSMTAPGASLNDRLRSIYGRLHVQALKVAILLAAMDWADREDSPPRRSVVSLAHWYRARLIVETWRASAHRLLADLGEQEEVRLENRILTLLRGSEQPITVREMYRALHSPRKPVIEALRALETDGVVEKVEAPSKPGRKSEVYRFVGK